MKQKKVIILDNEGGRLANQLWNYISIYAYCLENNFVHKNYSFWKYSNLFRIRSWNIILDTILPIIPRKISNKISQIAIKRAEAKNRQSIIESGNHINLDAKAPFYLTPTNDDNEDHKLILKLKEKEKSDLCFKGWLFRNPLGIKKHHDKIRKKFSPKRRTEIKVNKIIKSARQYGSHLVGVHIRKGDYKIYANGQFYFTEHEVSIILEKYLELSQKDRNDTVFIILSDEKVNLNIFSNIKVLEGTGNIIEDLFTLSVCDLIIGSDSTFGSIAAYLGNIPIVFFRRNHDEMIWEPVINKKEFNYYNGSLNIQH